MPVAADRIKMIDLFMAFSPILLPCVIVWFWPV